MYWIFVILAGLFEIGFALCLKLSENFTKVIPTVFFIIFATTSFALLNKSLQGIPISTAYAVWTGIGATGTAIVGMCFFHEPSSFLKILLIAILVATIVGLKIVSSE